MHYIFAIIYLIQVINTTNYIFKSKFNFNLITKLAFIINPI